MLWKLPRANFHAMEIFRCVLCASAVTAYA